MLKPMARVTLTQIANRELDRAIAMREANQRLHEALVAKPMSWWDIVRGRWPLRDDDRLFADDSRVAVPAEEARAG